MKKRLFDQECPWCHHRFVIMRDTFLLADPGSADHQRLRDGTYFLHQCQNCKKMFELSHPLLYKDPVKKFSVVLSSSRLETADELTILCHNPADFLFALSALDLGLDIKKALYIKKKLELDYISVKLLDYDRKNGVLWFIGDEKPLAIVCQIPPLLGSGALK